MMVVVFTTLIGRHFGDTVAAAGAMRADQVSKAASYQFQLALFMAGQGLQQVERRTLEVNGEVTYTTLSSSHQFPEPLKVNLSFVNADGDLVTTLRNPNIEPIRLLDRFVQGAGRVV